MSSRGLAVIGICLFLLASTASAGDEETVANPYYKFWSGFKPGATAVHLERTKLSGPEGKLLPSGVDDKRIVYKLVEVTNDRVVVEQVVTEEDFLGYIEAAPTRHIYPAKVKKSHLERVMTSGGGQAGEETVKVAGKDIKCRILAGAIKGSDGEQDDFKLWLSDDVPGTIVRQIRTARQKGELIAETTTTLESSKKSD